MLLTGTSLLDAERTRQPPATPSVDRELGALVPLVRAVIAAVLHESRDHADVEDGASETMRRAVEGKARLRPGEPLRPWVVGIARHVALDAIRTRRRQNLRRAREPKSEDDDRPPLYEDLPDPAASPFDRFAKAQQQEKIRAAMNHLPEGQRQALTLFHVEGLGYQEIAGKLGVPLGTVATWVARGRRAMASALGDGAAERGAET
jgi:RNA polymerase sigma-70 factor, ECF subfamily